ncbi:tetratricopeptide repeat protein [Sphingobium aquiterrae]|uniref:tetratricopeptide repeat protein n=1 Tax=Sphingobium aquiterrae TaxID=2038656 RepID=UPI0030169852
MNKNAVVVALLAASAAISGCTGMGTSHVEIRPLNPGAGPGAGPGTGNLRSTGIAAGHALFRQGEYALAMDAYRKVLRVDPANADAYNGLAVSYAAMGRYDIGDRFFQLALSFAPTDARILRNFARCLEQQGRHDESRAMLARLDGTGAMPTPRTSLAQIAARPAVMAQAGTAAQAQHLVRQSMGEVRLDTSTLGSNANTGQLSAHITVTIIDRSDIVEKDKDTAEQPGQQATATRAPRVATEDVSAKGGHAADRDLSFLRLWKAMKTEEPS